MQGDLAQQVSTIQQRQVAAALKVCAVLGVALWLTDIFQEMAVRFQFWAGAKRVPLFDLDGEAGIYTWLSSSALLLDALALFVVASRRLQLKDRFANYWLGLAVGFVGLSADESVRIHETINKIMKARVQFEGAFHFGWVIPALIICAVVGVVYLGFLRSLPSRLRNGLILAGAVYVGGAVGMEMLSGYLFAGDTSLFGYRMLVPVEEGGELCGTLMLLALLSRFWGELTTAAVLVEAAPGRAETLGEPSLKPL